MEASRESAACRVVIYEPCGCPVLRSTAGSFVGSRFGANVLESSESSSGRFVSTPDRQHAPDYLSNPDHTDQRARIVYRDVLVLDRRQRLRDRSPSSQCNRMVDGMALSGWHPLGLG